MLWENFVTGREKFRLTYFLLWWTWNQAILLSDLINQIAILPKFIVMNNESYRMVSVSQELIMKGKITVVLVWTGGAFAVIFNSSSSDRILELLYKAECKHIYKTIKVAYSFFEEQQARLKVLYRWSTGFSAFTPCFVKNWLLLKGKGYQGIRCRWYKNFSTNLWLFWLAPFSWPGVLNIFIYFDKMYNCRNA